MTKPITDKAEIALEYPDKLYVGTFERSSRFRGASRPDRHRADPRTARLHKSIHMYINFGLFADILRELAATVGRIPEDDVMHRDQLAKAVAELHTALAKV